jgi:ER-bound oxygenase mpaB/B'/Rubber oxygenase, catalytic domain
MTMMDPGFAAKTFQHFSSLTKNKTMELVAAIKMLQIPTWTLLGTGIVLYLGLVQILRFRSLRNLNKTYAAYLHDPYSLDYKTAHGILKRVMLYETPFMYAFGTQWALIKTYTVATGTGLLVQTGQLTRESTVGKRAEDTGVILTEFLVGSMDSDRGSKALAKMNWLHRRYGSKIKQPDLLHTLAMFVLEPIRWLEDKEWRPLTELEKVAIYVYWKEIGNRMGIKNIPDTLEELEIWTAEFTEKNVYYTKNNKICADSTMRLFLRDVPPFLRGFAQHAAVSLFEERSRLALGYEKPPRWIATLVTTAFYIRKFIIRHFFLPRLHELDPLAKPDSTGRLFRDIWAFEPWYVKATVKSWLGALFSTSGKVLPGQKYKSNGFLVEELGPVEYEKSSKEPVAKEAEEMRAYASKGGALALGCPFISVGYPPKYGA